MQVYKGFHGITAESIETRNGFDYLMITMKRSSGLIVCTAQKGLIKDGFSYMFGDEKLTLIKEKGRATAAKIKAIHAAGLVKFNELKK